MALKDAAAHAAGERHAQHWQHMIFLHMQEQCDDAAAAKLCNRAMRRRKARLQQDILGRAAQGPSSGKPRMLETHVWHAKRMQMVVRCAQPLYAVVKGASACLESKPRMLETHIWHACQAHADGPQALSHPAQHCQRRSLHAQRAVEEMLEMFRRHL